MKVLILIMILSVTFSVKWYDLENYKFEDYLNEY